MPNRTLLIDGDMIAYQFSAAAEERIDWGEGLWTLHAFEEPAECKMDAYLQYLQETLEADGLIICLSDDKENWRKSVLPSYKSNRAGSRKPLIYYPLKEHLQGNYSVFERPTLEADDILGILSTSSKIVQGEKIIVSKDKDFFSIPGKFYRTTVENPEVTEITLVQADYAHLFQTLMGDSVDGYSGCPGVGPTKAERILEPLLKAYMALEEPSESFSEFAWPTVVETYKKAKLSEEEALVMARVARILRVSDYDFKKKEVILWKPM